VSWARPRDVMWQLLIMTIVVDDQIIFVTVGWLSIGIIGKLPSALRRLPDLVESFPASRAWRRPTDVDRPGCPRKDG